MSGVCKINCQAGFSVCNSACVNLQNDPEHCGQCGQQCQTGSSCSQGSCVTTCGGGETKCSGSCSNLQSDVKNCGACGNVCKTGEGCCGGKCFDLQANKDNCGSCGVRCSSNQDCCSGRCADVTNDAKHCGACGNLCDANEPCQASICGKGAGASCNSDSDCKTGHVCGAPLRFPFCFQNCTSDSAICAKNKDGRTTCLNSILGVSICIKPAKKGESCAVNTTVQSYCAEKPGFSYCNQKGICDERIIRKKVGESCHKQGNRNEPIYVCDAAQGLYCDQKTEKCSLAAESQPCDSTGAVLGTKVACEPNKNLVCQNYTAGKNTYSYCRRKCTLNKECATGFACINGACVFNTCKVSSDCKGQLQGWICGDVVAGGVKAKECFPPQPNTKYYP